MSEDLGDDEMAKGVGTIVLPKKNNPKKRQNCHAISLIIHSSKIMLPVILIQLKAKA